MSFAHIFPLCLAASDPVQEAVKLQWEQEKLPPVPQSWRGPTMRVILWGESTSTRGSLGLRMQYQGLQMVESSS